MKNVGWVFIFMLFFGACLPGCMPANEPKVIESFDFRHPQPVDYPDEPAPGPTEIRFLPLNIKEISTQKIPYDIEVCFGADKVEPFTVQKVLVNNQPVEEYIVYNNAIDNLLRRANGLEDLSIHFLSNWQPNQNLNVEVIGTTPAGDSVKLSVSGQAPAKRPVSSLLGFQYPVFGFPYFHIHCTFSPRSYKPFTIESVMVNGKQVIDTVGPNLPTPTGSPVPEKYRILKGRLNLDHILNTYGTPEQIRAITANDAKITTDDGFAVDFPYQWKTGEEFEVVVKGKTQAGEVQELKARGKTRWDSVGLNGWEHYAAITVHETAGVDRSGEPVEVTLGLISKRISQPGRELRVVTQYPDKSGFVEVPSQILDVADWNEPELVEERDAETGKRTYRCIPTTTVQLVFLADMEAYEKRIFLICYGNPNATAPAYETALKIEGQGLRQVITNEYYRMGLSSSGALETVVVRGKPDVLLEHKVETNGAVHWNPGVYSPPHIWVHASDWEDPKSNIQTGPVVHRIGRYANMPLMSTVAAQVTYQFFTGQPYMLCESAMEVKEDIFVQALRNGEIVFNHAVLDEFVWKDELGEIQSLDLIDAPKGHVLEIPADTPWVAFISREHGVGFAGINVEYNNINMYGSLTSQAQPYFYVQKGPWYYWSRGLVHPYGHPNSTRMMLVRKGSMYSETNAYLPFHLAKGSNPFAEVEKYHEILTNPLRVTEHIPQDPETPRQPVPELIMEKK